MTRSATRRSRGSNARPLYEVSRFNGECIVSHFAGRNKCPTSREAGQQGRRAEHLDVCELTGWSDDIYRRGISTSRAHAELLADRHAEQGFQALEVGITKPWSRSLAPKAPTAVTEQPHAERSGRTTQAIATPPVAAGGMCAWSLVTEASAGCSTRSFRQDVDYLEDRSGAW